MFSAGECLPALEASLVNLIDPSIPRFEFSQVSASQSSSCWIASAGKQRFFIKTRARAAASALVAESDGLTALAATNCLRVPSKLGAGETADIAFLVLEYLELAPLRSTVAAASLGEALARLHQLTGAQAETITGWPNTISPAPVTESPSSHPHWPAFFATERLAPRLERASHKGLPRQLRELGERVLANCSAFFLDYRPAASLLHGRLWSDHIGQLSADTPVIFSPAAYRGDREVDLASAELFGGLPEAFYAAYRLAWPLNPGYETRKTLYNLALILEYYNLFGASYLPQAKRMIERLAAELRG